MSRAYFIPRNEVRPGAQETQGKLIETKIPLVVKDSPFDNKESYNNIVDRLERRKKTKEEMTAKDKQRLRRKVKDVKSKINKRVIEEKRIRSGLSPKDYYLV